ncbi:unnamed protein product [Closterium sp. NIES-54]
MPARRALLLRASRPAAALTSHPAALLVVPCCSQRVAPYCSQRVALCCPVRRALLQPAGRALLQPAGRTLLQPARRALLQPARRALLQPARRTLLPCASRPAAASASRPTAASALRSAAPRVALCCLAQHAPCCPVDRVPCPAARGAPCPTEPRRPARAALPNPSRSTLPRSPSPPSRPATTTAATSAHATAAAGSAGSAAGAGGAGGATGSAEGGAGAGGARSTTDHHCLSWPLSRRLGVDSGSHCLSRRTPPRSSFASGFFSEPVQMVEALVFYVLHRGGSRFSRRPSPRSFRCSCVSLMGPSSAEALQAFTLDSGTSRCFFRDCTTLTPLAAPVQVSLADPTGGPVVARASTVLPCPAVPSGPLSGLHLPTFSTNLVSNAAIQDVWVDTFIPGAQRMAISTCSCTDRHLAMFTRRPGSSLCTQTTASAQVAVAASFSCQVLSHQTLLWHHCLGHPSLPRLRGMHSRLLVSGLPRSLPSLPRSPAPPCLPWLEGRQRATPHSSDFPPTTAPLQTLHMDVWGPAPVGGTDQERYFLLVVDDYTRYTTVFPLRRKADVISVLIPWIRNTRCQLRERFSREFPVLRLHSDRGGEFSFDLLAEFCQDEGIVQSFTLRASPQQNGIAERRIGLIMEVARTSMILAAAPHFLWPFAVRYAAHQLNLWPRVSEPETLPTLRWMGKVGDASVFRVWGALSLVRDTKASKLSSRTLCCVFLGFPTDAPPWQFYHPRERRVFSSLRIPPGPPSASFLGTSPPPVDPFPPQGPAPSGVSQVDPPPLVEPLGISSDSSGPVEGGDPAADDTAATHRSPHLETPPEGEGSGGAATGGAGSGGAATGGAGSWGAATRGAYSRGLASPSGSGAAIRAWIVRRDSLGGGGYGPAGNGAASPGGTAGAGGTGGTAGGARGAARAEGTKGAAGAGGTRGSAGAVGVRATSPRGATGVGGAGPTIPGGTCEETKE